jgi:hypothetical protein
MFKKRSASPQLELIKIFILTAKKYVGYKSGSLQRNQFGERVGYDSQPWSGAFIDVVAREAGVHKLPSFVYTPAAAAEAVRNGLVVSWPRAGDIVIFNFATASSGQGIPASPFGMPHCGIVTDSTKVMTDGAFQVVEANTNGDVARQEAEQRDGVYLKTRRMSDVMMFIRPEEFTGRGLGTRIHQLLLKALRLVKAEKLELDEIQEAASNPMLVQLQYLQPGKRSKHIELVQLALGLHVDISGAKRGYWDAATRSAFARYQRNIGRVGADANGDPDFHTLQRLGQESRVFTID